MAVEINLVRHGETEANAVGVWQGTSDSALSAEGRRQVGLLGKRYAASPPDLLVTSSLDRARETAIAIGRAEVDARWRELHLGSWEGLTTAQIEERDSDAFVELGAGRDIAFGGGERISDMRVRLTEALRDLAGRLSSGERALVVTHGGAIHTLIGTTLGVDVTDRMLRLTNTGVTTVRIDGEGFSSLAAFNDSTHLSGDLVRAEPGSTHVVLARHGETFANLEGRWQGQSPGELTPAGRAQAKLLREHFPVVDALFTSPLARARDTALLLADRSGMEPEEVHALRELGFGKWEMMTSDEIKALDPQDIAAIEAGNDVTRGSTGETFAELSERVRAALDSLAKRHPEGTIGVVSHGAATRAFVTSLFGIDFVDRQRVGLLKNTAMARVVYGTRGPVLAAWNLTPHLES